MPLDAAPEATWGTSGGMHWFNWGFARFRLEPAFTILNLARAGVGRLPGAPVSKRF